MLIKWWKWYKTCQTWYNIMNIVTLWLKSDEKLSKKLQNCEKCAKVINSVQKWQKLEKVVKWANCNWTRFYKELLSQSFEILQMWPRHTQSPVFEIAIVSMVSMLFPWHFIGIIWHQGGMMWNAIVYRDTEDCHSCYGFYAISMAFQWNSMASRWNVVECHGIPWDTEDRIILTVGLHGNWV